VCDNSPKGQPEKEKGFAAYQLPSIVFTRSKVCQNCGIRVPIVLTPFAERWGGGGWPLKNDKFPKGVTKGLWDELPRSGSLQRSMKGEWFL